MYMPFLMLTNFFVCIIVWGFTCAYNYICTVYICACEGQSALGSFLKAIHLAFDMGSPSGTCSQLYASSVLD